MSIIKLLLWATIGKSDKESCLYDYNDKFSAYVSEESTMLKLVFPEDFSLSESWFKDIFYRMFM